MLDRRALACLTGAAVAASCLTLVGTPPTSAAPPEDPRVGSKARLGLGLEDVLDAEATSGRRLAAGVRLNPGALAVRDDRGRVRVSVTPQADVAPATFRRQAERLGLSVVADDPSLGTLEGFASPDVVRALDELEGTGTLALSPAPVTHRGDATSQGVAFQRVDRVQRRGVDGRGVTIGALSDSYDTATLTATGEPLTIRAADDVASGDLPGRGNPRNRRDVVVLEDYDLPDASDEGRAMLQIAHDVAPGSALCFATAGNGFLSFADNVRRLADPAEGCGADVIVDDITYLDEPYYADSALTDAIDDVAAAGVHYFSAAGNSGDRRVWEAPLRLVGAGAARDAGLDLSEVPSELYAGGFADLDQTSATDVATDLTLGEDGTPISLKWDDPTDLDGAVYSDPWFSEEGELSEAEPSQTFTISVPPSRVGQQTVFRVDGVPSGSTDVVITLTAPDGTVTGPIDNTTSPETIGLTLRQAGDYELTVEPFDESGFGGVTVEALQVLEPSRVGTDLSLLLFSPEGDFLGAIDDNNVVTGRPIELNFLEGPGVGQVVVARSTTGRSSATRAQLSLFGDGVLSEHVDPLDSAMSPHAFARGATGVAAYDAFRPFLPEHLTSPGGDNPVSFDSEGNRLRRTELRRAPHVAATDGGNTTFFTNDTVRDADDQPNFFGTSAAAPHAAAIAALVLQREGGGEALSPTRLRQRLQRTAFDHDLDPTVSEGRAGDVTLRAEGAQGIENDDTPPEAMVDDRFFRLSYDGRVPLRSLTLYGETASPTALGDRFAPLSGGIVFDPRPLDPDAETWRESGFPFTIGSTSGGLRASRVSATYSRSAGNGQFRRMTLRFADGLRDDQTMGFGIDRDLAVSGLGNASEGNGADELGGAVFLPQGLAIPVGMAFEAVRTDGRRIYGLMRNDLGRGFSPVDGYGVVDAEAAVFDR